jgi:hypothetical protein
VSIQKWPICPISALREKFNPRNIHHMPAVKFFVRLDLDPICLFLDGHKLGLDGYRDVFPHGQQLLASGPSDLISHQK